MATITESSLAKVETEGRLLNPVFKDKTHVPGRYGFRGDIALKFAEQFADEKRPPEISTDQVMAIAEAGKPGIPFMAGFLLSFEYLKLLVEVLEDELLPEGKYFVFCDNIDLSAKYRVPYGKATFYVLPIFEATVYNELLELLYLEKNDLKKLDTAGKLDKVAETALGFDADFETISYEDGLKRMGPVRNLGENRPV